ncbi:hypothetical protein CDL12_19216 [Handroanthus impetiginosus]|uniref:Peptidase S59 domain-containing protein n=1 Tax=Handroanthus impetiginosus TaxID=429701 RepID=A0A2G9GSB5_9LAMI|nr:hypothetical protein CDL12_19216 [Handroanthus impetiginosus]
MKKPFGSKDTVFGISPSFGAAGLIGDSGIDRAPRNSASEASTATIFGVPNNSGIGFKSNLAQGSMSSIFGVSKETPFAPGSSSSGFSTNIFGFPSTSAFQFTTTPGFGIKSRPSFWSASASAGSSLSGLKSNPVGAPSTPKFTNSTTSRFYLSSTSAPGTSRMFGIPSSSGSRGARMLGSTVNNEHRGSGVASYSATREVDGASSRHSVGKIQSICAMPIYKDRSHEELRLEDYDLHNKDGHNPWGSQYSCSARFKTSDTSTNIFHCPPLPNQSSVDHLFDPFKFHSSASKSQTSIMPNNTISIASTLSPSVTPFSPANLYPSPSQAVIPQPNIFSSMPTFAQDLNPSSITPFSESVPISSFQSHTLSSAFTSASASTISSIEPSFLVSPSVQSTSVTALAPGISVLNTSQPGRLFEKVDSLSANNLTQPSQGLNIVTELGSQNINGQQCASLSTVSTESTLVVNAFGTPSAIDRPSPATSIQCGISSLPVRDMPSPNRTSLLRIRHVSLRHNNLLPARRHKCGSNEPKVPFFSDKEDRRGPIAPLLPRENPRAWVLNLSSRQGHTPLHSYADGKICSDKACPNSSFQLNVNPTVMIDDASVQDEDLYAITNLHQDVAAAAVTEKHETDILSLMPKLPDGHYYTEPPIKELEAKERAEPGYCSHVNDFVVGRQGYGSIKFIGETDVRCLDLESIVQFNNREVIVYADDRKRTSVGKSLNKPAEVTLLNIKCISKKTGKQYIDGPQVHRYIEMLIKKAAEQGADFVSYDPVRGEWKFKVEHF